MNRNIGIMVQTYLPRPKKQNQKDLIVTYYLIILNLNCYNRLIILILFNNNKVKNGLVILCYYILLLLCLPMLLIVYLCFIQ